jgi:precorrin-6B methylase 2
MPETIVWKGRLGPFELEASDRTFRPTTISTLLAEAMQVKEGDVVVDIGCGTGVLAIIAARLGAHRVYGTDIAPDVIEIGTANAARLGVADRVQFLHGDLFDGLPADLQADLVIGDVSGIPDDLAAESGWFPSLTGGGRRGSELPIRMLEAARSRIRAGGRLLLPTGSLQDEAAILGAARSIYGRLVQLVERNIPLPGVLAQSSAVRNLVAQGIVKLSERGSRFLWQARVWEVTAEPAG